MIVNKERLADINKSIRRVEDMIRAEEWNNTVERYAPEVLKSAKSDTLTQQGKMLLTKIYAMCRKDGKDETYSASVSWRAVKSAGYVMISRAKVLKAIAKNMERLAEFSRVQKSDPVQQQANYNGIPIDLEWLDGQERHWEGSPYRNPMVGTNYGYIRNTMDGDGEEVDVYLSQPAKEGTPVFMLNQLKKDGTFDEHKFFLGFETMEKAQESYTNAMPEEMMGEMVEMSLQEFEDKYLKFHKDGGEEKVEEGLDATAPSVKTNNVECIKSIETNMRVISIEKNLESLVEKAGAPPGTRHQRADGTYIKQQSGDWTREDKQGGGSKAPKKEDESTQDKPTKAHEGKAEHKKTIDINGMVKHLNDTDGRGGMKFKSNDSRLNKFKHFELKKMNIEDLVSRMKYKGLFDRLKNKPDEAIKKYSEMDSKTAPPIVIGNMDEQPIDGNHRLLSAIKRGDKEIMAYVGVKK